MAFNYNIWYILTFQCCAAKPLNSLSISSAVFSFPLTEKKWKEVSFITQCFLGAFFIDLKYILFLCELKANPLEINTSFSKAGLGEEDEKVAWVTLPQPGRDRLHREGTASCTGAVGPALPAGGDSQQCPRAGRSGRSGRGAWQGTAVGSGLWLIPGQGGRWRCALPEPHLQAAAARAPRAVRGEELH